MIIAGTGHRPKYLPGKYDESHNWQFNLKLRLKNQLIQDDPKLVISGGALGWDMFLAEAAIELNIPFDLYLPFEKSGDNWPVQSSKDRLQALKTSARRVVFTGWDYKGAKSFYVRDEAMVDECDLVYALFNEEFNSGGTYYTVNYAKQNNKPIKNFWK